MSNFGLMVTKEISKEDWTTSNAERIWNYTYTCQTKYPTCPANTGRLRQLWSVYITTSFVSCWLLNLCPVFYSDQLKFATSILCKASSVILTNLLNFYEHFDFIPNYVRLVPNDCNFRLNRSKYVDFALYLEDVCILILPGPHRMGLLVLGGSWF